MQPPQDSNPAQNKDKSFEKPDIPALPDPDWIPVSTSTDLGGAPLPPEPEPLTQPVSRVALFKKATLRAFRKLAAPAPQYSIGTWLFLRLLGLCHAISFLSLWHQLDGLLGARGISPAKEWLQAVAAQIGVERFWKVPTLCWLNTSDGFRSALCIAGAVLGALVASGVATRLSLVVLWGLYLSICSVGGVFLGFQWDALLIEATFFAVFLAPRNWLPHGPAQADAPPRFALGALWWLVFRLMFLSGFVKVLSKDKLWANFTALTVHFQTQPLPTPLAWWTHHLPPLLLTLCCAAMFAIELAGPFLILFGRFGKRVAAIGFIALMGLVALTGNYCFFNLLVAAMCLPLLDNGFFHRMKPMGLGSWFEPGVGADKPASERTGRFTHLKRAGVLLVLVPVLWSSVTQTVSTIFQVRTLPRWIAAPVEWLAPFRTANGYGLFAVMTKTRPEIIFEGSQDGRSWKEYAFKWKAGDVKRAPSFVAPYQPRLDWQMWFAALGDIRQNPWFVQLMRRILEGEPSVLALLDENPFPEKPPRLLRAALFQYKFSGTESKADSGAWWERDYQGDYCPPISLENLRP